MIKVTDLKIDPTSLGKIFILAELAPYYQYVNGSRTDKIAGWRYTVVLPALAYEKLGIKVPIDKKATPLFDLSDNHEPIPTGIQIGFKGLTVSSYYSQGNINVTASAEDVFLIDNKKG